MSVSFENKETNHGVLTFTISQEQIKPALDRVFESVKKTLNVPGFRKGHIPRPIFNQRFGEEALYQDALNDLLPAAYEAAVKEAGIEVVAQPTFDVVSMEKGQDWTLTAAVVTKPEVKLGAYKDLEVSVEVSKEVTDADVDARIERERNNLAELVVKEGAAAEGDTVVIDFVGSIDGVEFDGGKGDNFSLGLGSGQFIPGFEDQLVGHSAGETVDVIVTFPEDYQAADLAGKEAKFVTTIHEVKAKELPELNDEFAQDVSEFNTLEEYKEDLKKHLEVQKEDEAKRTKEDEAIQKIIDKSTMEIPEAMIKTQCENMVNEFAQRLAQSGLSMEQYMQFSGLTLDKLEEQVRPEAETRIKSSLVLEQIAKDENIEVSEEEIDAEIEKMAKAYGMEADKLKEYMGDAEKESMKRDISVTKAVDLVMENVKERAKAKTKKEKEAEAEENAEENAEE